MAAAYDFQFKAVATTAEKRHCMYNTHMISSLIDRRHISIQIPAKDFAECLLLSLIDMPFCLCWPKERRSPIMMIFVKAELRAPKRPALLDGELRGHDDGKKFLLFR